MPQILGLCFGRATQVLGAVTLILVYLVIVSYQYRAGAAVAERMFPGLDQTVLRIAFAAFVILYTALAGLTSVALTDVVNGVVLSTGLLVGLGLVWSGWEPQLQPSEVKMLRPSAGIGAVGWISLLLPSFLLILGDANIYQRFMTARSPAVARRAAIGAFAGLLVLESTIIGVALFARVMLPTRLSNPGDAIIEMAFMVFPSLVGLLLAATAIAVIISTVDSYLLACSTCAVMDLDGNTASPALQRLLVVTLGVFTGALAGVDPVIPALGANVGVLFLLETMPPLGVIKS